MHKALQGSACREIVKKTDMWGFACREIVKKIDMWGFACREIVKKTDMWGFACRKIAKKTDMWGFACREIVKKIDMWGIDMLFVVGGNGGNAGANAIQVGCVTTTGNTAQACTASASFGIGPPDTKDLGLRGSQDTTGRLLRIRCRCAGPVQPSHLTRLLSSLCRA